MLGAGPLIIVGRSRHEERFPLAKRLGADHAIASDRTDLAALVAEVTEGEGVDVVLETTGSATALVEGLGVVRRGGTVTMLGSLPEAASIDMHHVVFDELNLNGVRGYNRDNVHFFLSALAEKKLDVASLVGLFPLSEWEQGFDARSNKKAIEPILVP
jgi:threonine dehydrogenase-like Zn-dependent dehydrogenase